MASSGSAESLEKRVNELMEDLLLRRMMWYESDCISALHRHQSAEKCAEVHSLRLTFEPKIIGVRYRAYYPVVKMGEAAQTRLTQERLEAQDQEISALNEIFQKQKTDMLSEMEKRHHDERELLRQVLPQQIADIVGSLHNRKHKGAESGAASS